MRLPSHGERGKEAVLPSLRLGLWVLSAKQRFRHGHLRLSLGTLPEIPACVILGLT
jgi:hypothetical protein